VLSNNYTLLGELGKIVALSPVRVLALAPGSPAGVAISLAGAPKETLSLSFVRPTPGRGPLSGQIAVVNLTLGDDGFLSTTLV